MNTRRTIYLTFVALVLLFARGHAQRAVTINDCIEMTRFGGSFGGMLDPVATFSLNGREFVALVWRGNLSTNVNEYKLLQFDADHLDRPPQEVIAISYADDYTHDRGWPLRSFTILNDGRILAIASYREKPRRLVSIDPRTKRITPLTDDQQSVLSYSASTDGRSIIYSAQAPKDQAKIAGLYRDGFSLEEPGLFDEKMHGVPLEDWIQHKTAYYLIPKPGSPPQKIYLGPSASYTNPPKLKVSPDGRLAVMYPFREAESSPSAYGLVNMRTGKIERLAAGDQLAGAPIWAADSKSLAIYTDSRTTPNALLDIKISDRKVTSTAADEALRWQLIHRTIHGDEIILQRSKWSNENIGDPLQALAVMRRTSNGWDQPQYVTRSESQFSLNPRYFSATNGRIIIGVKDGLSEPPELAAYDRESKRTLVLTNYNAKLRKLNLGQVSRIRWSGPYDKGTSFGYLIKPVGYVPGRKYPLIIQLKDEGYFPEDDSFILDEQLQLSVAAIQVWANAGFMVLLTPSPLSVRGVEESEDEDIRMTAHVDTGVDYLDSQGLIDRNRIAIAGWSRAGFYSETIVARAKTRFAAAASCDNVAYNLNHYILGFPYGSDRVARHWGNMRPWGESSNKWFQETIDFKYSKAQTPRLLEAHQLFYLAYNAEIYAALKTVKIPVDFYIYPDAPHNLRSPRHRFRSLAIHTDWFRFWLQNYEDPDPEKQAQYGRWRKMRDEWETAKATSSATK